MNRGRFSKQSYFVIFILTLSAGLTYGKTITVGSEPGTVFDYHSIQSAINAADEGDKVIVAEGYYSEDIDFKGKNIILISTDPNNWDVVENTKFNTPISRTHESSIVTFSGQENESCILCGFTIVNGNSPTGKGGGINGNGTKATIRKCNIDNNYAPMYGGGLYDCDGLIENCIISNNRSFNDSNTSQGGGLYGCDGTIKNCIIKNNSAGRSNVPVYFGDGGGLYNCKGRIENCIIEGNIALGNGGGLYGCDGTIENCEIKNNEAGYYPRNGSKGNGGGLYNCNGDINNCTIENNETKDFGGGLSNCMGTIVNCDIKNNTSLLSHAGGAADCNSFINCTISGNTALDYAGGLYNCKIVDRCTISGNSSVTDPGGGLANCNSVTNCIISGNISGGNGAGLYDCNEIINCTIVGNYSKKKAGALYFEKINGIIDNTIIWENKAAEGGQILIEHDRRNTDPWNLYIDYSDIQNGQNDIIISSTDILKYEPNNINSYPMFVQPGYWTTVSNEKKWNEGDYHLLQYSPCVDIGDPNRDYTDQNDIDSEARLIGLNVDIGADEFKLISRELFQVNITGPSQVSAGDTAQYNAIGRYKDDTQISLTENVTWSVTPEYAGTIDANGLFVPADLEESQEVAIRAKYMPDNDNQIYMAEIRVLCISTRITYHVDTASGNNNNDGLGRQSAFKTIQKAIDAAQNNDTVLVYPGLYKEGLVFWGKNITLKSAEEPAVIENQNNIAMLFCFGETNNCRIQNFIIKNSLIGIFAMMGSSPTIQNLTIVNNEYGIECSDSSPKINNCILWSNAKKDFINCLPIYSCTEDYSPILHFTSELNIHSDPLFADPNNGDYHLKSECGRYVSQLQDWMIDDQTSPCIDAGNPDDNYSNEPAPNGGRINIGAYGNTTYASKTMLPREEYKASQPIPNNGDIYPINPTLQWTAGLNAIRHDVYLGTDINNVSNATSLNPLGVLVSEKQTNTSFTPANYLSSGKVYFWRVDELSSSGTLTKGDIWTFITSQSKTRGACFVKQTLVWIKGSTTEISKAAAGENVTFSKSVKGYEIVKLLEHKGTYDLLDITLESGDCITVAGEHYFMTQAGRWISSSNLKESMLLRTAKGVIKIKSITKRPEPFSGKVYNLDIKNSDKYLVGKDALIVRDY